MQKDLRDKLIGGVIMDVTTPEQAKIAADAGAVAVMALERVPADIRAEGGVARMSAEVILRSGSGGNSGYGQGPHRPFVEAQILKSWR